MSDGELKALYRSINRIHTREEAIEADTRMLSALRDLWPGHEFRIDWRRIPAGRGFMFRPSGILAVEKEAGNGRA